MVEGLSEALNWLKSTSMTTSKMEKRLNLRWEKIIKGSNLGGKILVKRMNLREIIRLRM